MRRTGQEVARPRVALVAAALAAACGGEEIDVRVTLTIDEASCTIDTPDWVELTCPTAVGVSLWGAESESRLEGSCLDLPGTDRTLEALPPLLESVELSTSADEPVRLEIGLFAPRAASDGCPDVAANDALMLLKGDTEPTDLSSTVRGLAVEIQCVDVDVDYYESCYTVCDDSYNACFETGWCQQEYDTCAAACAGDTTCVMTCQTALESCSADECTTQNQECLDECGEGSDCGIRCGDEHEECLQFGACDARYTTCLNDCDAATPTSCAAIY